jgi:hypothetical protein
MKMKLKPIIFLFLIICALAVLPLQIEEVKAETSSTVTNVVDTLHVDWTAFWQKFNKYAKWDLEWYNSTSLTWQSIKSDLTIQKAYPKNDTCKITLIFNSSQTGNYRLTFGIDVRVKKYVAKLDKYQYELDYGEFSVVFDWSDVVSISGLVITHGVKKVAGQNYFWFRMRKDNIHKGVYVEIDPSVVGTSTSETANRDPQQRKDFYIGGYFWKFYYTYDYIKYSTSVGGITWSNPTNVLQMDIGSTGYRDYRFATNYGNGRFHFTYGNSTAIYYMYGTQSGRSITWSSLTTVNSTYPPESYPVNVAVDSNGIPFVSWTAYAPTNIVPLVAKATDINGTSWGNAVLLENVSYNWWTTALLPLTVGKMAVLWTGDPYNVRCNIWNGSAWGTQENVTGSDPYADYLWSAVAEGDNIRFVVRQEAGNILYFNRTWGTGWGTATTVQASVGYYSAPVLTITSTDNLYCYWAGSPAKNHIYYKKYTNSTGVWDTNPTDWITETTLKGNDTLSGFYQDYDGHLGLTYMTGTASPYQLKFADVTFNMYSLTVYVTRSSNSDHPNTPVTGATLTLTRTDGYNYTADGLSPATTVSYNSTHARYVWSQLANQSASYTVTANHKDASYPESVSTSLTGDTEVEIELTIAGLGPSGSEHTLPPVEQQPYIPPVELPKVPGPEFQYGIMVLVGVVGVAFVVGVARVDKRSSQTKIAQQWQRKTRYAENLEKKWKKKTRSKNRR